MDLNDPRRRLQVLNQSSPSIRLATSQVQTPQLKVASSIKTPTIQIAGAPDTPATPSARAPIATPSSDQPFAGAKPPTPTNSGIGGFFKSAANVISSPFRPLGAGIARLLPGGQNDLKANQDAANQLDQNQQVYNNLLKQGKINKDQYARLTTANSANYSDVSKESQRIADTADRSQVVGSAASIPLAIFAPGGSLVRNVAAGSALGLTNELATDKDPTLKGAAVQTAAGAATGGVLSGLGVLGNKLVSRVTGKAGNIVEKIASETSASKLVRKFGIPEEAAGYLSKETNPETVKLVLDELSQSGVPIKGWVESPALVNPSNAVPGPDAQISGTFDPANPPQSYLPNGTHAPGAPDPVEVLTKEVADSKTEQEFRQAYDKLSGEDKAIADSALNGKSPEEFYASVKGEPTPPATTPDTTSAPVEQAAAESVPQPETPLPQAESTAPADVTNGGIADAQKTIDQAGSEATPSGTTLPPEDIAAIKAAGGTPPEAPVQSGTSDAAPQGDLQSSAQGDIPSEVGKTADPQVETAKQQVMDSLGNAQSSYEDAAATRSAEKGVRAGQATSAFEGAGGGSEGVQAKLKALKGEYTKSSFTIDIPKENMDVLHNAVESNPELKPFEKTNAQVALMKLNGDVAGGPTPYDIGILRKAFGNDFADSVGQAVADSQTTSDKFLHGAGQVVGLPKSIMASYDLSATLRQGGILASRFPKEAAQAFGDELKYFASTDAFQKGMQEIANRPSFDSMMKAKLAVTGTEALDKTEEQFVSNLAEKIPGFGRGVAASDRAYTGFLTKLRADVFDNITKKYADEGIQLSDKELHDIATYINTASGRGDLGKYLEQHSQTLSTALFSPRLWKSRLDMLNPVYYAKLSGPARKYAIQSAATFAGEASIVLGLASLAGAKVETDMRSSDFGKIKVGNTRYDILGGLQQNIVFAWREVSGQKKNSETGDVTDLTAGKFGAADRLSTATDMIQNKENPALAAGQRILQGHDRGGNPVNPITELANLVVPLPVSGMVSTAKDTGSVAKGIAMNLPDLLGVSAQTYGTIPTKDQGKPMANGLPEFKGEVKDNMVTDANGKVLQDAKGKPITVTFPKDATELEKQAILDSKRTSALKDQYVRTLPAEDQKLMKLTDQQLQSYVDSGRIDQARFDHIKNIQKTAESQSKENNYDVPKGVESDLAKQVYQKYNSMDAKDQKYWLSDKNPPDEVAKQITSLANGQRMDGLSEFKPSNALAKLYADYEKKLNNNADLTEVDKRNEAKKFQTAAAKLNLNANQNDIYAEGGSSDLKTLIENKQIDKADLDAAMKLDEELYNTGLTGSLKFSKKFREAYGYNVPTGGKGPNANANGSTKHDNAHLDAFIPSGSGSKSGGSGTPAFSARSRTLPSFKNVNLPQGKTAPKVTIKL